MADMVKAALNGKYDLILPKHRADRPEWYTAAGWERARLDSMHDNIRKGDVVYYVGSEEGEFPALCQIWGAKVFMFEPNPKVWSNTRAIWEANNLTPPITFDGFCSEVDNFALECLKLGFPESAMQEIEAAHGFKELNKEADNYPQIRIDTVWKNGVFEPPKAICLDVEGSEGHVLRGAEQTLRKYHPKIWLSLHPEFLHEQYGEWGAELRRWIIDLGYKETLLDYPLHEVHLLYEALK